MKVRIYVGGLPLDVTNVELRERFGRFVSDTVDCQLTDVDLIKAKSITTVTSSPETSRGFAYLTLEGAAAEAQSEKLQKTFHRTKWRGSLLKVQLAKPSYQLKLQREWEEEAEKRLKQEENRLRRQQPVNLNEFKPLTLSIKFQGKKITRFLEEDVIVNEKEFETKSEVDDTDVEMEANADDVLNEEDVEAFVRKMEQVKTTPLTKEEVNARRLATLKAKQERKKENKAMIVIPRLGESLNNKKITFDDSGNECEPEETSKEHDVITKWLDSSDDEADGDERRGRKTLDFLGDEEADTATDKETQLSFALRPEFLGEKGKKLFELQKRYGGDSRFRLDARFLEQEMNEYGGNEVDEEEESNKDANITLQHSVEEENSEFAERLAHEMREEETIALRVLSKLFPDVDVTRLERRLFEQRVPKEPLKEAAWMGELKRYDPRDVHACRELELSMTSSSAQTKIEDESTSDRQRVEKEILTGGDRFFSTSDHLSSLFTRVRTNSEDGIEGEAALDGVTCTSEANSNAPFKLSSLFSLSMNGEQSLAAMGEQLLEDESTEATSNVEKWVFSQEIDDHDDEAMATDSEAGDEVDDSNDTKVNETSKRVKKSLEDFIAFGRTFVGTEDDVADWPERRKKLTLDYKRKRRDAGKMKKRAGKFRQTNAIAARETSKRKKTRL
ncbi:putative RNA recognition motif domain, nucleotide-binding alpha-beta plait domain superfamily [Plasmopara halstedii]